MGTCSGLVLRTASLSFLCLWLFPTSPHFCFSRQSLNAHPLPSYQTLLQQSLIPIHHVEEEESLTHACLLTRRTGTTVLGTLQSPIHRLLVETYATGDCTGVPWARQQLEHGVCATVRNVQHSTGHDARLSGYCSTDGSVFLDFCDGDVAEVFHPGDCIRVSSGGYTWGRKLRCIIPAANSLSIERYESAALSPTSSLQLQPNRCVSIPTWVWVPPTEASGYCTADGYAAFHFCNQGWGLPSTVLGIGELPQDRNWKYVCSVPSDHRPFSVEVYETPDCSGVPWSTTVVQPSVCTAVPSARQGPAFDVDFYGYCTPDGYLSLTTSASDGCDPQPDDHMSTNGTTCFQRNFSSGSSSGVWSHKVFCAGLACPSASSRSRPSSCCRFVIVQ